MDLLDLIFPKKCVNCGRGGSYICTDCEVGLWEAEQVCPACFRSSEFCLTHPNCKNMGLDGLSIVWHNEGLTRKIINLANYQWVTHPTQELINRSWNTLARPEFKLLRQFIKLNPVVVVESQSSAEFNLARHFAQSLVRQFHLQAGDTKNLNKLPVLLIIGTVRPEKLRQQVEELQQHGVKRIWVLALTG